MTTLERIAAILEDEYGTKPKDETCQRIMDAVLSAKPIEKRPESENEPSEVAVRSRPR